MEQDKTQSLVQIMRRLPPDNISDNIEGNIIHNNNY